MYLLQRQRFHGHFQYLFIESICNDTVVLEQNYRYKMMYSPDYAGFNNEQVPSAVIPAILRGKLQGICIRACNVLCALHYAAACRDADNDKWMLASSDTKVQQQQCARRRR